MRIAIVLAAFFITFASPVRAGDDISGSKAVITSQIDALRRDDAATAYSFASPVIQDMFPSSEIFMAMVQQGYAPLYKPSRFEPGEAVAAGDKIAQRAHIVDSSGVAWEALYTLERQPDGSLKISGCSLLKADQGA